MPIQLWRARREMPAGEGAVQGDAASSRFKHLSSSVAALVGGPLIDRLRIIMLFSIVLVCIVHWLTLHLSI